MTNLRACCYAVLLACSLLPLGGCGGGGGGTAVATAEPVPVSPPPMTSGIAVNLQPPATTVTYQAAATTVIGAQSSMGNITMSAAGQGATVTLTTDASGNLSGVAIPAGGITDSVTGPAVKGFSLASPVSLGLGVGDTLLSPNSLAYSISQAATEQSLTASAYGLWASTLTTHSDAGAFAFGNLTPPTSIPTTGSATFNGRTAGFGGPTNGGAVLDLDGNAQIIANFGNQAVTTNLTNFSTGCYCSAARISVPDLSGTSAMTANAYAGTISGGGLTGAVNGNFYGSNAQETAGVWQASGGGNAWIGSFGATKQ